MKKALLLLAAGAMSCASAFGQWNSNPAENLLAWPDEHYYTSEMQIAPNGNLWLGMNYPSNGGVCTGLQLIDPAGNILFDEPLVVADFEAKSWTAFGQILLVDKDGNAIVSVVDQRYGGGEEGYESHTVYKISQEGEFLWGETGITLEGVDKSYSLAAGMSMAQLSDGSYVFAWMHTDDLVGSKMSIEMQRLSADGELLWNADDVRITDDKTTYMYPFVIDGGYGQTILIFAKGSAQDIYASKLDFDGTPVWSEDTRIYNGGWGSIPIWTLLTVTPTGDGGALLSWNDDRYFTQIESAYMAYIKPNGEIGFTTDNGQILGLSGWRSFSVKSLYDPDTDNFYAIWNEASSGQSWNRVVAQRVNKEGELLWGENGLELKPMEQTNYGYLSLQKGINDEMAFFYMRNYSGSFGDVEAFVTAVNVNDTTARRESEFTKGERVSEKTNLKTTPMHDGKFWIALWSDNGSLEEEDKIDRLMMQRINNDLTLGNPNDDDAVERVEAEGNNFAALASIVENEAMFVANTPANVQATLSIYNMNGALVATPFDGELAAGRQYISWLVDAPAGIYLATLSTPYGTETVKLLVK